jgi:hydroxypyruvate isomerase
MPKFAANLSMMFNEVPFLERFGAAAGVGFAGVEYLFPYDFPAEAIAERLRQYDLKNVLFNLPPGNWAAGERGITCLPGREDEFRAGVATAIDYATRLRTVQVHAMAGIVPQGARGLRPGRLLRFEVVQTGVRSQPCWFGALASPNRSNSPVSPLTPPLKLTALLGEGSQIGQFRTPVSIY